MFTGEISDSDTGSIYMKLEKLPAALLPKDMSDTSAGAFDPRRRPLVDISNGDYSDMRKHLQQLSLKSTTSTSTALSTLIPCKRLIMSQGGTNHHVVFTYSQPTFYEKLKSSSLTPNSEMKIMNRNKVHFEDGFQIPDSALVLRTLDEGVNISTINNYTRLPSRMSVSKPTLCTHEISRYARVQSNEATTDKIRHLNDTVQKQYIDDILNTCGIFPNEEIRFPSKKVSESRQTSFDSTLRDDIEEIGRKPVVESENKKYERMQEPIYEQINSSRLAVLVPPYSEISSKKDNVTKNEDHDVPISASPDFSRRQGTTPFLYADSPLYENCLELPIFDITICDSTPFEQELHDSGCEFTSFPQQNIHKPVAVKWSKDLIERLGKSSNGCQHSMPHYGFDLSQETIKKSFIGKNGHATSNDKFMERVVQSHYENVNFLNLRIHSSSKITTNPEPNKFKGQHIHARYRPTSAHHDIRSLLPIPSTNNNFKNKENSLLKVDSNLHAICEGQTQGENKSATKDSKSSISSTDIESSYDSTVINKSPDSFSCCDTMPVSALYASQNNENNEMLKSIHSSFVIPQSPHSLKSNKLLENASTAASFEDLTFCKEKGSSEDNLIAKICNISSCCYSSKDSSNNLTNKRLDVKRYANELAPLNLNNYLDGKTKNSFPSDICLIDSAQTPNKFVNSVYIASLYSCHSFANIKDISSKYSNTELHNTRILYNKNNALYSPKKSQSFASLLPANSENHNYSLINKRMNSYEDRKMEFRSWHFPLFNEQLELNMRNGNLFDLNGSYTKGPGSHWEDVRLGKEAYNILERKGKQERGRSAESCQKFVREIATWNCSPFKKREDKGKSTHSLSNTQERFLFHTSSSDLSLVPYFPYRNPTLPGDMGNNMSGRLEKGYRHTVPSEQKLRKHAVREKLSSISVTEIEEKTLCSLQHFQGKAFTEVSEEEKEEYLRANYCSLEAPSDNELYSWASDLSQDSFLAYSEDYSDQDSFSEWTFDCDLVDIGQNLYEKIRKVSEEKMLGKLRRSFRKKESFAPKFGIFMFTDNPMYLSPEVKKEHKIISTPGKPKEKENYKFETEIMKANKNIWYMENPMYDSPSVIEVKKKSSSDTEKENIGKKGYISNNSRRTNPLADRLKWIQTNPCYESPSSKLRPKVSSSKTIKRKPISQQSKFYVQTLKEDHHNTRFLSPKLINPTKKSLVVADKFMDHEYCFVPGEDPDCSILSHFNSLDSLLAKRSLKFDGNIQERELDLVASTAFNEINCNNELENNSFDCSPTKIWRLPSKSQQPSMPLNVGPNQKKTESKTKKNNKRDESNKHYFENHVSSKYPFPDVPLETNAFHHARYEVGHDMIGESSSMFQLPPDGIYESLSFLEAEYPSFLKREQFKEMGEPALVTSTQSKMLIGCILQKTTNPSFDLPKSQHSNVMFINNNEKLHLNDADKFLSIHDPQLRLLEDFQNSSTNSKTNSRLCSSFCSCYSASRGTYNTTCNSISSETSTLNARKSQQLSTFKTEMVQDSRDHRLNNEVLRQPVEHKTFLQRGTLSKKVIRKYKAREVLHGKGQLKLSVYENHGLLTIYIIEARKLRSSCYSVCNPYVKISLVPDNLERTFCRTPLLMATNAPNFNQKFSFDFLPEDLDKRLLISLWSRDTFKNKSEFLGCMSFRVSHIIQNAYGSQGAVNDNKNMAAVELEDRHVLKVYEEIAEHFNSTRYKPWPKVNEFVSELPFGSILLDVGCGNGKYMGCDLIHTIGCDTSPKLLKICAERKDKVILSSCLNLPFRNESFDAAICIAVIHHLASEERRVQALKELARVIRIGGRMLVYVWAMEQNKGKMTAYLKQKKSNQRQFKAISNDRQCYSDISCTRKLKVPNYTNEIVNSEIIPEIDTIFSHLVVHENRTEFARQDLLVPWKIIPNKLRREHEVTDGEALVFYRFYHIFRELELEGLCINFKNMQIINSYYDEGNWCLLAEKT